MGGITFVFLWNCSFLWQKMWKDLVGWSISVKFCCKCRFFVVIRSFHRNCGWHFSPWKLESSCVLHIQLFFFGQPGEAPKWVKQIARWWRGHRMWIWCILWVVTQLQWESNASKVGPQLLLPFGNHGKLENQPFGFHDFPFLEMVISKFSMFSRWSQKSLRQGSYLDLERQTLSTLDRWSPSVLQSTQSVVQSLRSFSLDFGSSVPFVLPCDQLRFLFLVLELRWSKNMMNQRMKWWNCLEAMRSSEMMGRHFGWDSLG